MHKELIVIPVILLAICCCFIGFNGGQTTVRQEAIKNGNAIYVPDVDGSPKFQWRNHEPAK